MTGRELADVLWHGYLFGLVGATVIIRYYGGSDHVLDAMLTAVLWPALFVTALVVDFIRMLKVIRSNPSLGKRPR